MSSINSHKIAKYSKLLNNTSDSSMAAKYRQKLGYYQGQSGGQWGGETQAQIDKEVGEIKLAIDEVILAMEAANEALKQARTNKNDLEIKKNIDLIAKSSGDLILLQARMYEACKLTVEQQVLAKIPTLRDCDVNAGQTPLFATIVANANGKLNKIRGYATEAPATPQPAPGTENPNLLGGYYNYNETEDIGNWVNRLIN
jgi:hypothetical protein